LIRTLLGGGRWAVGQTIAATGAFMLKDFVHVMDVLHFRMHRALETGLAAKAAGDAETLFDSNLHFAGRATWIQPPPCLSLWRRSSSARAIPGLSDEILIGEI
jgi:hypothetical protein